MTCMNIPFSIFALMAMWLIGALTGALVARCVIERNDAASGATLKEKP